uniref:Tubulin polyglutamylase TTLL4 n=2 Tax=Photinus pyralis TaxID=7054 RepID=A0A1Y1KUX1_PHOPY
MAQCDLSLSYPSCKTESRYCKFAYSWCPTCDKDSPRRRSKSETNEPCRRKGREMKGTSKRCDWNQECENMELEYEPKDIRYEICRVRSNLCELPTTYITNNCQTIKLSNADFVDITEKGLKCLENTFKSNDCGGHFPNYGSMNDKSDRLTKLFPKIEETTKNINSIVVKLNPKLESLKPHFTSAIPKDVKRDTAINHHHHYSSFSPKNNELANAEIRNKQYAVYNCERSRCYDAAAAKFQPMCSNVSADSRLDEARCYDTYTAFDRKIDVGRLKQCYALEVELLKEKLKELKNTTSDSPTDSKDVHFNNSETIRKDSKSSVKVSIKTKVKNLGAKPKKKSKGFSSSTDMSISNISDSEDSDLETLEDNEDVLDQSSSSAYNSNIHKGGGDFVNWPIRESLFPFVPPYITFTSHAKSAKQLPSASRHLKWKLSTITPILIRKTLTNSGFRMVRSECFTESNDWMGTWGKHMKSPMFKTLKETQKLNHFPGTFQLGRKDRLWRNFQKCIHMYGYKEFGFIPRTYVLPQDLKLLRQQWQHKNGEGDEKYIIKPPASARGTGIKVINRWTQLPKRMSLVVQEYIANPYLINRSKFDLRLYVLVTSFDPLRIYLYPDGLVRFASVPYSVDSKDLKDRYMHLTNYSINKLSSQYTANEDANACKGHKWTLSTLWEYMEKKGVNTKRLWKNLQELVIKTIITAESTIVPLCRENMNSRYSCYELFGVDVLLDEQLKTWLLEVNISPSLHSQSPLDEYVKGPMIQSMFNLVQFHLPKKLGRLNQGTPLCYDPRLYSTSLTKKEANKQEYFCQSISRQEYAEAILENLTGDDVRHLTKAEDELTVVGNFERIFPTSQTHRYLDFLEVRYYNRLFDAWECKYEGRRQKGIQVLQMLCQQKMHLKVAPPNVIDKNLPNSNPSAQNGTEGGDLPMTITSSALPETPVPIK